MAGRSLRPQRSPRQGDGLTKESVPVDARRLFHCRRPISMVQRLVVTFRRIAGHRPAVGCCWRNRLSVAAEGSPRTLPMYAVDPNAAKDLERCSRSRPPEAGCSTRGAELAISGRFLPPVRDGPGTDG